ncbi:MAG: hypothetical protein M0002_07355 [Rhodospirillales bacterium]|nr:hypothetical protein [Rhodospirillales bacterium]
MQAKRDELDLAFDLLPRARRGNQFDGWSEALAEAGGFKYISVGGAVPAQGGGTMDFQHGIAGLVRKTPQGPALGLFDPNIGPFHASNVAGFPKDIDAIFNGYYKLNLREAQFTTFQ